MSLPEARIRGGSAREPLNPEQRFWLLLAALAVGLVAFGVLQLRECSVGEEVGVGRCVEAGGDPYKCCRLMRSGLDVAACQPTHQEAE